MITVTIGSASRKLGSARDVDASWINEQIRNRRAAGQPICFTISIHVPPIELNLPVGECGGGGGGSRGLRPQEQPVVDLYRKRHLDERDVEPGSIVSFLRQVFDVIR